MFEKKDSKKPFFTIIIPTFNSAKTIKECIESVIRQTFSEYEILLIDGVSTDETLAIAMGFNDNRIKIRSEQDQGIYDAMNKGIKDSLGKWLYFLGSDDSLYDVNVLEFIYYTVVDGLHDVVYGNVMMIPSNTIYDGLFTYEKMQTITLCHQAIFYKRKIFDDFGLYNIKYKVLADHDMNLKWFFSSHIKSTYLDRIIAYYSVNGYSSIVRDNLFYDELPEKLIRLGINKFNFFRLKELAIQAANTNYKNNKPVKFVYYKFLYFIFRFFDLFKRKVLRSM